MRRGAAMRIALNCRRLGLYRPFAALQFQLVVHVQASLFGPFGPEAYSRVGSVSAKANVLYVNVHRRQHVVGPFRQMFNDGLLNGFRVLIGFLAAGQGYDASKGKGKNDSGHF